MKQEVTRMHKKSDKSGEAWSLDDVDYISSVKPANFDPSHDIPNEGVYIN